MLSEDEIDIIRSTAEAVVEGEIALTNAFYTNLFKAAPEVRAMFPEEMFDQSEKLWASIVMVVESVDDLSEIAPALEKLGKRHVGYGAKPEHYPVVCSVLLETMAQLMGRAWTDKHQATWHKALSVVSNVMLEGARRKAA